MRIRAHASGLAGKRPAIGRDGGPNKPNFSLVAPAAQQQAALDCLMPAGDPFLRLFDAAVKF